MLHTAKSIVETLKQAGHTAYFAGGCVRDQLLGKEAKDVDIATSALPEEIEALFQKTFAIGKSFGVILVEEEGHHFEIATFRNDSGSSDGRRPDAVLFTNPEEDAKRRDFTINGLFFDPVTEEIHDFIGGQNDLKNRLVRFIGNPEQRILEDHLRIIRAIRFKNTLDFSYHPETYQALKKHAHLADKVSWERVRDEFKKIVESEYASEAFEDMQDTGVLPFILPELEACKGTPQPPEFHHEGDVWNHLMHALKTLPKNTTLAARLAVLFHDIGKPETFKVEGRIRFDGHATVSAELTQRIMQRLRFPRRLIEEVSWAVAHHFMMKQLLDMPVGRKRHWYLNPFFPTLLTLYYADAAGTDPVDLSLYQAVHHEYQDTLEHFQELPKPLLSGEEIMKELSLKAGPQVGELLKELTEKQLAHEIKNPPEALAWLKQKKA